MSEDARASQNLLSCGFAPRTEDTHTTVAHAHESEVYEKPNKFPTFHDGDVVLVLSGGRIYQLHSGVLRRNCEFFANILAEEYGATLTSKAKVNGATTRYRLDLNGVEFGTGQFVRREVDNAGRSAGISAFPEIENGKVPREIYKHYDNLLRAFYNLQLDFDDDNLATVLRDSMGLVGLAENYHCASVVAESVDVALLRHGQVLFKSIQQNPIAWANFACRIQSPTIYKDALIHIVGKWKMFTQEEYDSINPVVHEIAERHFNDMSKVKQAIEMRIAGHYPNNVQRTELEEYGRAQYANDIYAWMAISLFRHWFAQNVLEKKNFAAKDGGARFYRQLQKGGQAYLDRTQCKGFHVYCPMSPKGKTVFENHLSLYKSEIQPFVKGLMTNHTQLELSPDESIGHLLCLEVGKKDYPWTVDSDEITDDGASQ